MKEFMKKLGIVVVVISILVLLGMIIFSEKETIYKEVVKIRPGKVRMGYDEKVKTEEVYEVVNISEKESSNKTKDAIKNDD